MAIKDSIVNLKRGLRTTLTNVPALIDTLIRGLDGVAEAAEKESAYSTDEKVIGTWIDGKQLYEKIINFGALPNSTNKDATIPQNIEIREMIGTSINTTNKTTIPIPYISLGNSNAVNISAGNGYIRIATDTNRESYDDTKIRIRYTKTSASRSPEENDTKNDGDEEKKDDER